MMWIGDQLISNDEPAPRAQVPDLAAAYARFRSPELCEAVSRFELKDDAIYDSYQVMVESADKSTGPFTELLEFFANTRAIETFLNGPHDPERRLDWRDGWLWNAYDPADPDETPIDPVDGLDDWSDDGQLFAAVPPAADETIAGGWLLHRQHGRIDADVTCMAEWYLFETDRRFAFVYVYTTTLH